MLGVEEFVGNAILLVVGAIIIYALIQTFCETYAGFCEYGWLLMGAYIFGAVLYLRYALSKDKTKA